MSAMLANSLKIFFVPETKLILFNKNGLSQLDFLNNTTNSLHQLLKNKIFQTTNPEKYLIIHIGALGFSGTEGGYKSNKKIKEFISTLKKPYELIIIALDGIFIDSRMNKSENNINYVRNLGLVDGSRYINPKVEADDTYTRLLIIPGFLNEDSVCIRTKAYFDMQKPGVTFVEYMKYPEITTNITSNLLVAVCKKAIDEGGIVFIQSYLNWDGFFLEPINLGFTNVGSNFENLVSFVQQLYKLDHSKIFLIPHNNRCEKSDDKVVDTVHPFFSEEAITKFVGNTCLEARLVGERKRSRAFEERNFLLSDEENRIIESCIVSENTSAGGSGASADVPAAGAGAAGGSRRRRGKKLRRTVRRKGRVWMR